MSKFAKDIKKGLEEIIDHKEGKITLRSEVYEVPDLKDKTEALKYLNKAVKDPDIQVFLCSLKNIVKARADTIDESVISLARIKRVLDQKHPKFFDIVLISEALGFRLVFVPKDSSLLNSDKI